MTLEITGRSTNKSSGIFVSRDAGIWKSRLDPERKIAQKANSETNDMKITIETKSEKMVIETEDEGIITCHSESIYKDKDMDWDAWQKDFYDTLEETSEDGGV